MKQRIIIASEAYLQAFGREVRKRSAAMGYTSGVTSMIIIADWLRRILE